LGSSVGFGMGDARAPRKRSERLQALP
jgi:hypothetical protein